MVDLGRPTTGHPQERKPMRILALPINPDDSDDLAALASALNRSGLNTQSTFPASFDPPEFTEIGIVAQLATKIFSNNHVASVPPCAEASQ
jgi:hypothetical protein